MLNLLRRRLMKASLQYVPPRFPSPQSPARVHPVDRCARLTHVWQAELQAERERLASELQAERDRLASELETTRLSLEQAQASVNETLQTLESERAKWAEEKRLGEEGVQAVREKSYLCVARRSNNSMCAL
jgi:sirohydrochlorin ferrochelatase